MPIRNGRNAGCFRVGHVLFQSDSSLHCQFSFVMCELFAVFQRMSTLLPGTRRALVKSVDVHVRNRPSDVAMEEHYSKEQ
jgi:hypothetical protein